MRAGRGADADDLILLGERRGGEDERSGEAEREATAELDGHGGSLVN